MKTNVIETDEGLACSNNKKNISSTKTADNHWWLWYDSWRLRAQQFDLVCNALYLLNNKIEEGPCIRTERPGWSLCSDNKT